MGNYKYLICVSTKNKEDGSEINNNKFYEMKENDDGTFTATYGRIGDKTQTKLYDMHKWNSVYNQKTKKVRNGYIYKDITHLKSETKTTTLKDVSDPNIMNLLTTLQGYSKQSIIENYTVTSESVTQAQVDEAQKLIDEISKSLKKKGLDIDNINDNLTELYAVIPRKMRKVKDHLLKDDSKKKDANKLIKNEQDTLDVMRGQVSIGATVNDTDDEEKTLESILGVSISMVENDETIEKIKNLMGDEKVKFRNAYEIIKHDTQKAFDKQKNESVKHWTKLLWHGSRNENWLNILKTGLKIRPAGAVITGAMFGYGQYFADRCRKSIGYTSLSGSYWAGGNSSKAFLALFEVNTGMELRVNKHESWMYDLDFNKLREKGDYDSLFALKGVDLYNNEYIVYKENQCTIKYLIEIS